MSLITKRTCCGGNATCPYEDDSPEEQVQNGVCWGEVGVVDEEWGGDDYYWIHRCEGHTGTYLYGKYIPPPEGFAARALFTIPPEEFGKAAVNGAKKNNKGSP